MFYLPQAGTLPSGLPTKARAVGKLGRTGTTGQASVQLPRKTQKITSLSGETGTVSRHLGAKIHSVVGDSAVYVLGQVGGQQVEMLVDTGSAVTLVHQRLMNKVHEKVELHKVSGPVVSANGQPLDIRGTCDMHIRLQGVDVIHPVLVAGDVTQDCLLGMDFLDKHECKINFADKTLHIGGEVAGLVSKKGRVDVFKLSLAETVVVPGRHEIIMPAVLKGDGCSADVAGIVEPSPGFTEQHDLLLARIIAQPKGNMVPVRLVNPSPTPVTLYENTSLGTFCQLEKDAVKPAKPAPSHKAKKPNKSQRKPQVTDQFDVDGMDLNTEEKTKLADLLNDFRDIFSTGPEDIGRTGKVKHRIDTGEHPPIKQAPRRVPIHQQREVLQHVEDMQKHGVIEPSTSPWAAPIVLVKKKDGTTRFCVDYRKLNDVTRKDAYPLPRIDETLDALSGAKLFTTLDLASGYWQVEMDPADREKTAFTTRHGLFEFRVMPFGLCNAPGTFQRLMEFVLAGLQWQVCLVYLDDVIVYSRDFNEHVERLREVFQRLRQAGLKLKPKKCHLLRPSVPYLGHVISAKGVSTDPAKVDAVKHWRQPANVTEVRSFLGLASYYRRFIQDFAEIAAPLHRLTCKSPERKFNWTPECEHAFKDLKQKLVTAPVLAFPCFDGEFIVDSDASDYGLGAVLSQKQDGHEKVIAYASRVMEDREKRYSVTKKEMLAMVYAIKHFRHYLYGRPFTIRTDHNALRWLQSFKEPEGQVARWLETLAQYDYKIQHRPGKKHTNADALSRKSPAETPDNSETPGINVISSNGVKWLRGWTLSELQTKQKADPRLQQVLKWKETRAAQPLQAEVQGTSRATRSLWAQWNRLELKDGILYRRWETEDGQDSRLQLVLPRSLMPDVLTALHDAPIAGHLGVSKTVERVRERFYWYGLRQDVEDWCRQCDKCARRKSPPRHARAPLVSSQPGYPFERIALDIMGPLPETDTGNKYIMVVGDYFTKWSEAYAIPNQEAKTVADKLVKEFICRYGAPEKIHSDQGRNFESQLFQEMCKLFAMEKTRTTPYHPESDGMVERMNRTVQDMLAKYVADHQRDWDMHLPLVMMAYRSSVHGSSQYTPYYLMFGQDVRLPVDVMFGRPPNHQEEVSEYVRRLRETLEEAHEHAREHLKAAQRRQKDYYDKRTAGEQIQVGDRVFLCEPAVKKGRTKKLLSPWQGPYVVRKRIGDVAYRIQLEDNPRKRKVVHFNRLKLCVVPQVPNERQVAAPAAGQQSTGTTPGSCRPQPYAAYVPDETDLMYMDESVADPEPEMSQEANRQGEVPEQPQPVRGPGTPVQVRPRREIREPAWMQDFVS